MPPSSSALKKRGGTARSQEYRGLRGALCPRRAKRGQDMRYTSAEINDRVLSQKLAQVTWWNAPKWRGETP